MAHDMAEVKECSRVQEKMEENKEVENMNQEAIQAQVIEEKPDGDDENRQGSMLDNFNNMIRQQKPAPPPKKNLPKSINVEKSLAL